MTETPQTVRRPVRDNTDLVRSVLHHLKTIGVGWAPVFVGVSVRKIYASHVETRLDHLT